MFGDQKKDKIRIVVYCKQSSNVAQDLKYLWANATANNYDDWKEEFFNEIYVPIFIKICQDAYGNTATIQFVIDQLTSNMPLFDFWKEKIYKIESKNIERIV